jgi:hypothetical protein
MLYEIILIGSEIKFKKLKENIEAKTNKKVSFFMSNK